jgi:hypothetical protein
MKLNPFDIVKREDDGDFVWIDAAHDLDIAKSRAEQLCGARPGEYVIFDQTTQQIVAKVAARATNNWKL